MNSVDFNLHPFQQNGIQIQIQAHASREENILKMCYQIAGDVDRVKIPKFSDKTARLGELWETTCLEFFLASKNSPNYWEFNLSPSGDWNIYAFTGYRESMVEEKAIAALPFKVAREPKLFQLDLTLDLTPIIPPDRDIDLGITAVIESEEGDLSYWALNHCGRQPDFHLRDSFHQISAIAPTI